MKPHANPQRKEKVAPTEGREARRRTLGIAPRVRHLLQAIAASNSSEEITHAIALDHALLGSPTHVALLVPCARENCALYVVEQGRTTGGHWDHLARDGASVLVETTRTNRPLCIDGDSRTLHADDRAWLPYEPAAIVALPLARGDLVRGALGLVYREKQSFGADTRALLQLVSVEAALVLDRAELRRESREEAERMRFLADASELLATTIDWKQTLTNVAHVAVPRFADWVAVDILEGNRVTRVAIHHEDPEKVELARALFETYPPRLRPGSRGLSRVLTHGEPAYELEMTARSLDRASRTPEHRALLDQIGLTSYVIAPLVARGEVRGALSFGYAESGRHYDESDVWLALDLGRRAGMALENARLFDETQKAQRELAYAKRRFENIAAMTPDVLYVFDIVEGRNLYTGGQVDRVIGTSEETLRKMGATLLDRLIHPDDRDRVRERLAAVENLADGEIQQSEYRVCRSDGSTRWIQDRAVVFARDTAGRPTQILGIASDVTEERARREALLHSEERYRLAIQAVAGIIYDWDVKLGTVDLSPGFVDLIGFHPEEVDHSPEFWIGRIVEEDREETTRRMREAIDSDATTFEAQYRVLHRDGSVRHVWDRSRLHRDEAGRATRVIGFTLDITERVTAENRLRESELALREADRRKDEFLAMLAHELRNPLTPIRNAAEILRTMTPSSGPVGRATAILQRQVGHMARLVDDLLDVSRITRGKIRLEERLLELEVVVARTVEDMRPLFEAQGVTLEWRPPTRSVHVVADETRIGQVIGNLLHNAVKFTERGGRVTVALEGTEERVRLLVRDTGIGLEDAMIEHIFEPFSQGERGMARTRGGLGLGLALVKGLVEQHGGHVEVSSAGPGQGSEFVVELPTRVDEMAIGETGGRSADPASGRGMRILVIEDNPDAAETLQLLLDGLGFRTAIARTGREGIERARAEHPDAIICDIGLPEGFSGYDVARAVRSDPELHTLRLIAMSGYGQDEDRRRGREAGFDCHLTKPADLESIRSVLLARAPGAETPCRAPSMR